MLPFDCNRLQETVIDAFLAGDATALLTRTGQHGVATSLCR